MARKRHPDADIERAVQYAEQLGWRFEKASARAHAWGHLLCPKATRQGCIVSVWSTPRSGGNHARKIRKSVDNCPHGPVEEAGEDESP